MLLSFVKGSANPSHCTWRKKINMAVWNANLYPPPPTLIYKNRRRIKVLIWKWIIAVIDATFAVAKRKQRSRVWIPYKPEFYSFRLSFHNCKSIIASITAMIYFHIILQPAVHIYDFHIFVYSNFNKNTLIQLIFLCCYILVHVHEV